MSPLCGQIRAHINCAPHCAPHALRSRKVPPAPRQLRSTPSPSSRQKFRSPTLPPSRCEGPHLGSPCGSCSTARAGCRATALRLSSTVSAVSVPRREGRRSCDGGRAPARPPLRRTVLALRWPWSRSCETLSPWQCCTCRCALTAVSHCPSCCTCGCRAQLARRSPRSRLRHRRSPQKPCACDRRQPLSKGK